MTLSKIFTAKPMAALFLSAMGLFASAQGGGCADAAKSHQFDFWIGEWEVTSGGKVVGHNSIQPILDGCVLQETWAGAGGSAGSSFNYYNPKTDQWHQFWVWRNGTTLPLLSGKYADGKMMLAADSVDAKGKPVKMRITWYNNPDGTVRQHWEASSDAGASWQTRFDGLYRKKE
jgi:hypothetical protein